MSDHDPQCYMPTSEHRGVACFGDLAKARADERERIAAAIEAVDPVEWALAGQHAGRDAARIARRGGRDE